MLFFKRRKNKNKRSHKERRVPNNAHYMGLIWGLNIGVVSAERIKIGDMMKIGKEDSITNCLTTGKLP